jgi:RNA polymerase sigma-70 factor (ECF subfamily)
MALFFSESQTGVVGFKLFGRSVAIDDNVVFEELVSQYESRLYSVAFRMAGNHDAAQDLVQDAIVEAFRSFSQFRRGTYFDKWLYRIMSRTFIDSKRAQKRAIAFSLEERNSLELTSGQGYISELRDSSNDPANCVERDVISESVQNALDSLPAHHRLVVILTDIEEFSYEEVSQMLGCPTGTVRSRLHRARSAMLSHLNACGYVRT